MRETLKHRRGPSRTQEATCTPTYVACVRTWPRTSCIPTWIVRQTMLWPCPNLELHISKVLHLTAPTQRHSPCSIARSRLCLTSLFSNWVHPNMFWRTHNQLRAYVQAEFKTNSAYMCICAQIVIYSYFGSSPRS